MPMRAEQIGQQAAEQQADHDVRIVEREIELDALEVGMLAALAMKNFRSSL